MPIEYNHRHGGCAIICGAAPSVLSDLEKARKLRPSAEIIGVKFASNIIPEIDHVWTQHGELSLKIKQAINRPIIIHARPRKYQNKGGGIWFLPTPDTAWQAIDYVWPQLNWAVGSSGIAGALWARHGMGFDEVIMAGIPLDPDNLGYAQGYGQQTKRYDNTFASAENVKHWLQLLKNHKVNGKTDKIYSMSGMTKEVLGAPC
jgi:hypothetical protein